MSALESSVREWELIADTPESLKPCVAEKHLVEPVADIEQLL